MRSKKYIKISIFIFIFVIINFLLFLYFQKDKEDRISIYFQQKVAKLFSEYRATKNSFKILTNFVHDEINTKEDILKIIYQIKYSKKDEKILRKELYNRLYNYYQLLKKYKIYYITLFFPDGNVIFRMHQPYKYGDNLYSKNNHILSLNKNRLNEIDIGIVYNYPLFYKGKLLANFKTSISYDVLKQELTKLFNSDYEYIIKKDFISNSAFKIGHKLFIESDLSEDFFYEENSIKRDRSRVTNKTIHKINQKLKSKIKGKLNFSKNFAEAVYVDGNYYVVTFLAISPFSKNSFNIGYLISYEKDDTYKIFDEIFYHNIILGNIIIILILSFIYYVLQMNEKLKLVAATDKLTSLYNRNKFYEIALNEIERSKRYKRPLSLIIFDIDHFKKINDNFGHNVGDQVLRTISKIIKNNIRKSDWAFRWGGEEFIILAPETDLEHAEIFAQKLRKSVENYEFDKVKKVTISLGVAEYDINKDKDIDSLVNRADEALYKSKESGRNRVTVAE